MRRWLGAGGERHRYSRLVRCADDRYDRTSGRTRGNEGGQQRRRRRRHRDRAREPAAQDRAVVFLRIACARFNTEHMNTPPDNKSRRGTRARSIARKLAMQALYQWQMTSHEANDLAKQFIE